MRKILSKYEQEKKRKRSQLVVGLILIFVMFFSVLGYSFVGRGASQDDTNKIIYNEYEFVNQNGLWILNLDNVNFVFRYNPEQVPKVYSWVRPFDNYYQKPVYISSESPEAETEIYVNLNQIALRMQRACLSEEECGDENLPIKTCSDNFIIIEESNITDIIQQENCVFIQGPEVNLTRIADEFLFKILGIEQ